MCIRDRSNTYPTCLILGDSLSKERLISDSIYFPHGFYIKEIRYEMGDVYKRQVITPMSKERYNEWNRAEKIVVTAHYGFTYEKPDEKSQTCLLYTSRCV